MSEPVAFTGNDLDRLLKLHEAVFDLAENANRRLVVEVWDDADQQPVAWIDVHPADSEAHVTFERRPATEQTSATEARKEQR